MSDGHDDEYGPGMGNPTEDDNFAEFENDIADTIHHSGEWVYSGKLVVANFERAIAANIRRAAEAAYNPPSGPGIDHSTYCGMLDAANIVEP